MLTDYFTCYKLNNTFTLLQEVKISPKLNDCQIFIVIKIFGEFKHLCSLISKRKKSYFLMPST